MCDSTNAERPGFTMSEKSVGATFDEIFSEHKNTRIIIATFASNVDRVQQIINSAEKFGRKVGVEGRSMVNIISTASELGYLKIPDNTLVETDQLKNYPDEKTVLIFQKGADVIFQDVHVSGHACQEEIKLIYSLVKPKYSIPVHGEYKHLMAQAKVVEDLGMDKDNIFILSSGDVLELDEEGAEVTG